MIRAYEDLLVSLNKAGVLKPLLSEGGGMLQGGGRFAAWVLCKKALILYTMEKQRRKEPKDPIP